MGINLIAPGSASPTAALFYDTGAFGATAKMTEVNGVPVSAAVEIQSTSGALLLPRMTTTQRLALTTVVDGMQVYDTTVGEVFFAESGSWVRKTNFSQLGILYSAGDLDDAQLLSMFTAPELLLEAPDVGFMYVINGFMLNLYYGGGGAAFVGGGDIRLQYGVASNPGAGFEASEDIPDTMFTGAVFNKSSFVNGSIDSVDTTNSGGAPIAITNDNADFTVGTESSARWHIWYSIVPVV